MATVNEILEDLHVVNAFNSSFVAANEDIFNGSPASDVLDMSGHQAALCIIHESAGGTGTATITVESCDDTTPTTSTAVAFKYRTCTSGDTWGAWTAATASGFTTSATANSMYQILITADGLSGSNKFVRFKCTEVDSTAVDGGMIVIMLGARYKQSVQGTVLT